MTHQYFQVLVFNVGHVLENTHHHWTQGLDLDDGKALGEEFLQLAVPLPPLTLSQLCYLGNEFVPQFLCVGE